MTPDYELDDQVHADTPAKLKAVAHQVRSQILDLVLERAATVTELASALDRPKSSVAYHVDLLVEHGFLRVVRTRKVRAIQERFYGRTARTIVMGPSASSGFPRRHFLAQASASARTEDNADFWSTLRHARIPAARAEEFFGRVVELAESFTSLARDGDTVYGFVSAVYETDHPSLPDATERAMS